eukprot:5368753-Amphidinium_carterae.1
MQWIETQTSASQSEAWLVAGDFFFAIVFSVEIIIRFLAEVEEEEKEEEEEEEESLYPAGEVLAGALGVWDRCLGFSTLLHCLGFSTCARWATSSLERTGSGM